MISESAISPVSYRNGKLTSPDGNLVPGFLCLRDDNIPPHLSDGVADIGIISEKIIL